MSPASVPGTNGVLRSRHLTALSIGTFALGIDGFVLSGLLPQVAASLHVPTATAGQLTTLFALVYAVGSPLIATATGNWDRRRLLLLGMVVFDEPRNVHRRVSPRSSRACSARGTASGPVGH